MSTYFIVGLIHGELHHVCLTILPYLFALPSFVNIFQIYSMSNLHDVSWGTRPQGTVENAPQNYGTKSTAPSNNYQNLENIEEMQKGNQKNFMLKTVVLWLCSNLILVVITWTSFAFIHVPQVDFMNVTMGLLFTSMIIRMIGSTMYACQRYSARKSPWLSCLN